MYAGKYISHNDRSNMPPKALYSLEKTRQANKFPYFLLNFAHICSEQALFF
jgi:hypothetical protein